jgi:hypothetical protein
VILRAWSLTVRFTVKGLMGGLFLPMSGSRCFGPLFIFWLSRLQMVRKKLDRLAVQPRKSHRSPQTFAATGVERNNFVLRNAVEMAVRPKAQTAGPAKFGEADGREDANELSASGVAFPYRSHRVECAERMFARHDDVAIGCDRQIKRAEFRVTDQLNRQHALIGVKSNDSVVAHPIGTNPRGEKKSSVMTEPFCAIARELPPANNAVATMTLLRIVMLFLQRDAGLTRT